uniref:Uncharacterized protein n=1 Tax=Anguilla anguilla TaxID=7936 RepID=A0A0E9RK04_ANGAN
MKTFFLYLSGKYPACVTKFPVESIFKSCYLLYIFSFCKYGVLYFRPMNPLLKKSVYLYFN